MEDKEIKSYLEHHLEILKRAVEDENRSGEELKAITEAIEITVKLLKTFNFTPSDSNGYHSSEGIPISNPLIEN